LPAISCAEAAARNGNFPKSFGTAMLFAIRSASVRLKLWLLLLTLLGGCSYSPLPLSVAGTSERISNPIQVPRAISEEIEGDDSVAESSPDCSLENSKLDSPTVLPQTTQPSSATIDPNQLVGCWRDGFCGQRTLTLNSDGTATMVLELDFAGRLLYGKTLEFDMRWKLNESILSFEILTGRPVDAAQSAIKLWGEAFEYRLELVDNERLHGRNDDATLYKLQRVTSSDTSSDSK
jgi:hypothetical protein